MKVSIVMPVFNCEEHVREALKSIESQTYKDLELIIIEDCSRDGSRDAINNYDYNFMVKMVFNEANMGVAKSRNIGIREASGELIAFLDADDFWEENKIEVQVSDFKNNSIDFSWTGSWIIDPNNNSINYENADRPLTVNSLMKDCYFRTSSVMARASIFKEQMFKEDLKTAEDYELWLRLTLRGAVGKRADNTATFYRLVGNSLSKNIKKQIIQRYLINKENFSTGKMIYSMMLYIFFATKKRIPFIFRVAK